MKKLPVFATAFRAYTFSWQNFGTLLRLGWLPLLLSVIAQYLIGSPDVRAMHRALEAGDNITFLLGKLPWLVAPTLPVIIGGSVFAVALHRRILFGESGDKPFLYLRVGRIELLFVAILLVANLVPLILMTMIMGAISAKFLQFLLALIVEILVFFFWIRLSLVFPLTVLKGHYDFGDAWRLARGNFWRLAALWFSVIVPVGVIGIVTFLLGFVYALATDSVTTFVDAQFQPNTIIQSALNFVSLIVSVGIAVPVLCYAYKEIERPFADDLLTGRTAG